MQFLSLWWALGGALGVATVVGAMDDEMAEMARMLRENCVGETGVDAALIDAVNGGAELPADPKLKCYIKCFMETAGMYSEGAVDEEAVLAVMPDAMRAKLEAAVRACGTQAGADDCDTAYRTHVCWQRTNKADYFLV